MSRILILTLPEFWQHELWQIQQMGISSANLNIRFKQDNGSENLLRIIPWKSRKSRKSALGHKTVSSV